MEEAMAAARAKIAKILAQIEGDDDAPRLLLGRLRELETEELRLSTEAAHAATAPVLRLPTNYEAVYRQAAGQPGRNMGRVDGASSREAVGALIERMVVHGGNARGGRTLSVNLHGDLFRMLEFVEHSAMLGPKTHLPRH